MNYCPAPDHSFPIPSPFLPHMGLPCQDIQARNFFKKVADYRKLWKLQEQDWLRDDESPGDHADDDCDYINDDNPDASPPDGSIPHLCSLGFLKVAQKWKALTPSWLSWELGGGTMTPAQKAELASVLAGIEEMKIRPNSTCIPFFSCMSMLPNQISDFCIPAG